jgi:hypothetical protein
MNFIDHGNGLSFHNYFRMDLNRIHHGSIGLLAYFSVKSFFAWRQPSAPCLMAVAVRAGIVAGALACGDCGRSTIRQAVLD